MSNINTNPDKVTQTQNAPKKSYALSSILISLLSLAALIFCDKTGILFADVVLFCIVPCVYCCILIKSDNKVSKALPGLCLAAGCFVSLARAFAEKQNQTFFVTVSLYGLLAITLCAILFFGYTKFMSKTQVFAGVSVATAVFSLINYVAAFFIRTGKVSVSAMVSDINNTFETVKTAFINQLTQLLQNDEAFAMLQNTAKNAGMTGEVTLEKIIATVSETYEMYLSAVKMCIPSAIAIVSMISAVFVIFAFTLFAKLYKIKPTDTGGKWEYTISTVSTRMFNFAIFAALLGGFFALPKVVTVAALNLAIILMLPLDYMALKGISQFLRSKNLNRAARFGICIVALLLFSTLMQGYGLMILAFVGVYITNYKERLELFKKYKSMYDNDNNNDDNNQE